MAKQAMSPIDFLAEYRDRLATLRKAAGMSQKQMADYLGVDKSRYAKWEGRDKSGLPVEYVPAVCAKFGVTAWFLLTGRMFEEHLAGRAEGVAAKPTVFRRSKSA